MHLGNKHSLKELTQHAQNSLILQQCVTEGYCLPEAMNLVMISQGEKMLCSMVAGPIALGVSDPFHVMQKRVERLFCLLRKR